MASKLQANALKELLAAYGYVRLKLDRILYFAVQQQEALYKHFFRREVYFWRTSMRQIEAHTNCSLNLTVMVFLKLGSSFSMLRYRVISSKMRRTSEFKLSTVRTSLLMLMAGVRELVSARIRSARQQLSENCRQTGGEGGEKREKELRNICGC